MQPIRKDTAFTKEQIAKIGNAIVYLCERIKDSNKTKILKTLFLLEEESIKRYGYPFFNIDFQLWKHGPVAKDIFIDLSEEEPCLLAAFIQKDNSGTTFNAKKPFDDGEFSDNDIALLEEITGFVKDKNANYLVQYTHDKDSLWRKSALQNDVLELLESECKNSTEFVIDFSLLFQNDKALLERFENAKENSEFIKQLKG